MVLFDNVRQKIDLKLLNYFCWIRTKFDYFKDVSLLKTHPLCLKSKKQPWKIIFSIFLFCFWFGNEKNPCFRKYSYFSKSFLSITKKKMIEYFNWKVNEMQKIIPSHLIQNLKIPLIQPIFWSVSFSIFSKRVDVISIVGRFALTSQCAYPTKTLPTISCTYRC